MPIIHPGLLVTTTTQGKVLLQHTFKGDVPIIEYNISTSYFSMKIIIRIRKKRTIYVIIANCSHVTKIRNNLYMQSTIVVDVQNI